MSGTTPAEGMTWDLGALRDGVRAAFGPDQRRLVSQSIQSVRDRRRFSAYHYQEAMRIIAAKVDGLPGDELLPIMMGVDDNDTGSFEDARFTAMMAHLPLVVGAAGVSPQERRLYGISRSIANSAISA
nr:hypothetical protein [Xanthomonas euvesicatoria]